MERLANNPVTALNGSINNSTTSVVVDDASKFPTSGPFTIKVESELIRVTGVSSNTFTVVRGQESTSAASHADDVIVSQVITNNVMTQLFAETYQVGGYSSRPSTAREGTIYHATDVELAWRRTASQWDLIKPANVPFAYKVDTSGWTNLNFGTNVWTDINGTTVCEQVTGEYNVVGKYHALPSAPFSAIVCIGNACISGPEIVHGILLYNTGTTTFRTYGFRGNSDRQYVVQNWNSVSSLSSNVLTQATGQRDFAFLKFEDDNTNWNLYFSYEGTNWIRVHQQTRNTFVTPDRIGLFTKRTSVLSGSSLFTHFLGYGEV